MMPQFVPVDHDPFSSGPQLVPVDHDPFSDTQQEPQMPTRGQIASALVQHYLPSNPLTALSKYVVAPMAGEMIDNPSGAARTMLDKGMDVPTFARYGKWTDALGASLAQFYNSPKDFFTTNDTQDPSLVDALSSARQDTENRLKSEDQNMPYTSGVSQAVGALMAGNALGATGPYKALVGATSKVGPAIGLGPAGSAILQDSLSALPLSWFYRSGQVKDDQGTNSFADNLAQTNLGDVARDTALATGASALNQIGGKLASPSPVVPSADELKKASSAAYKSAEQSGSGLAPTFTNRFIQEVDNLAPQTTAGKIMAGNSDFTDTVERIRSLKDMPMSLQEAQEVDEALSDAVDSHVTLGKVDKQGKKILDIQNTLRDMIANPQPGEMTGGSQGFDALNNARDLWAQSRKMADVEKIMQRAEQTDNPATAIKNGFRTLYNNPGRMRGYTQDEKEAIRQAAEGSMGVDALRTLLGSRLISSLYGYAGGGLGGTIGASIASQGARSAAAAVQAGKANNVARIISNGGTVPAPQLTPPLSQRLIP